MTAKASHAVAKAVKKACLPGIGAIKLAYPNKKICSRGFKKMCQNAILSFPVKIDRIH
jgi:hypothetical protein